MSIRFNVSVRFSLALLILTRFLAFAFGFRSGLSSFAVTLWYNAFGYKIKLPLNLVDVLRARLVMGLVRVNFGVLIVKVHRSAIHVALLRIKSIFFAALVRIIIIVIVVIIVHILRVDIILKLIVVLVFVIGHKLFALFLCIDVIFFDFTLALCDQLSFLVKLFFFKFAFLLLIIKLEFLKTLLVFLLKFLLTSKSLMLKIAFTAFDIRERVVGNRRV